MRRLPRRFSQKSIIKQAAKNTTRYVNASIGYSSSLIPVTAFRHQMAVLMADKYRLNFVIHNEGKLFNLGNMSDNFLVGRMYLVSVEIFKIGKNRRQNDIE